MKTNRKIMTILLTAAILLASVLMTGCTDTTGAQDRVPAGTTAPAASDGFGVYVRLEMDNAASLYLRGGSFSNVCKNADGSPLKAGEWIFTGADLAETSRKEHCSVLFTVGALDTDGLSLGEAAFLYDESQERLYVTISPDGVTCSTSDVPDAPADVSPVLTLPILDEINETVTIGTSGSSLLAVQAAVKLLDWGLHTGLSADEIEDAASTWLAEKNSELDSCLQKLALVDDAYQRLLTGEARELLDSAGCEDVSITWDSTPAASVEVIMQAAGLRG